MWILSPGPAAVHTTHTPHHLTEPNLTAWFFFFELWQSPHQNPAAAWTRSSWFYWQWQLFPPSGLSSRHSQQWSGLWTEPEPVRADPQARKSASFCPHSASGRLSTLKHKKNNTKHVRLKRSAWNVNAHEWILLYLERRPCFSLTAYRPERQHKARSLNLEKLLDEEAAGGVQAEEEGSRRCLTCSDNQSHPSTDLENQSWKPADDHVWIGGERMLQLNIFAWRRAFFEVLTTEVPPFFPVDEEIDLSKKKLHREKNKLADKPNRFIWFSAYLSYLISKIPRLLC